MALLFTIISMQTKAQFVPGGKLDDTIKIISHSGYILSGPASIEKACKVIYQGHTYHVTLNPNQTIKAIFVYDKSFSTPDSVKIGMPFSQLKASLADTVGQLNPGWAKYFTARSGWKIAFAFDHAVTGSSKVEFIFR